MLSERRVRDLVVGTLMEFVWMAAFPRLSFRLRWSGRLGLRGSAIYLVVVSLAGGARYFVLMRWVEPWLKGTAAEHEHDRQALRNQLGREPTGDELMDYRRERLRAELEAEDGGAGRGAMPRRCQ